MSPRSQGSNVNIEITSQPEDRKVGEEVVKRRRTSVVKEESGSPTSGDEYFAMSPCIANMGPGVRITAVAVGGRHTLALSGNGKLTNVLVCCKPVISQHSYLFLLVTPYSFVGYMKYEDTEDF